jgi:hypothetical protein
MRKIGFAFGSMLLFAGSSGCWRGDTTVEGPRASFVARVNAVAGLQRRIMRSHRESSTRGSG